MLRPITVPCPTCGNPMELQVSDQQTIVNGPYVSLLVLQHPKHATCRSCGAIAAPAIQSIQNMRVIAQLVPEREAEQRVIHVG